MLGILYGFFMALAGFSIGTVMIITDKGWGELVAGLIILIALMGAGMAHMLASLKTYFFQDIIDELKKISQQTRKDGQ
ncbi:MAG: hypothetical protein A2X57_06610 [Nitrospirae bacterium GWD2_57_8]|nr:MAG: hypothetical protein A2X57_06610 [Nitrospirae bacterium GWD2_57_8]